MLPAHARIQLKTTSALTSGLSQKTATRSEAKERCREAGPEAKTHKTDSSCGLALCQETLGADADRKEVSQLQAGGPAVSDAAKSDLSSGHGHDHWDSTTVFDFYRFAAARIDAQSCSYGRQAFADTTILEVAAVVFVQSCREQTTSRFHDSTSSAQTPHPDQGSRSPPPRREVIFVVGPAAIST